MGSKLGINGFGRIGRLLLRAAMHRKVPVGAINNPFVDADYLSYLFKFDSTHGRFPGRVCSVPPTCMQVDGGSIPLSYEADPAKINWKDLGVEYVAECSGAFLTMEKAGKHIEGGAKKVIISAPSPDAPMFVCGVNLECYKPEMCIISNASCTTNGLAPLAKVVHEHFTICEGLMTTIHSVTATQKIVDGTSGKAWRDGRSGMANMIPASTGAAKAVGKVLPELDGKLTGMSIRVPTPNVSIVDLTIRTAKPTSIECIKTKVKEASEKELKGILQYIEHDLVSMDMNCSTYSSVFDSKASMGLNSKFFKLISWYDNEYGYANRLLDLILHVCETDKKAGKSGGKKDEKKPAKAAAAK